MSIIKVNSLEHLVDLYGGKQLYGYKPKDANFDATKLNYPVKLELNEKDKTFVVHVPKQEVEQSKEEKENFWLNKVITKKNIIYFGCGLAVLAIVLFILL